MHFLPDDDDEKEEDADDDEAVLNLMRMATMMRITMVRSKRELNRCIFSHSWRCFWKKKDLLANQVDETNVFRSCSWEDVIHFFFQFSDTSPGRAKPWDTRWFQCF